MESDGRMVRRNGTTIGIWPTARSLDQLLRLVDAPPHAGSYLAAVPADLRAAEFNHIMRHNADRDRPVVLRVRRHNGDGDHEMFAAVTTRYTPLDADKLVYRLLRAAESDEHLADARAEATYDELRTSIRVYRDGDVASAQLGRDETFASVLDLRIGDDKSTRWQPRAFLGGVADCLRQRMAR